MTQLTLTAIDEVLEDSIRRLNEEIGKLEFALNYLGERHAKLCAKRDAAITALKQKYEER
jgi:hypothetical protein